MWAMDVNPIHLARATDPEVSHVAARAAVALASRHQRAVIDAMTRYGRRLGAEQIADSIGWMPAYAVRKRLPELERAGLIEDTGDTRMTRSGRPERVWRLLGQGAA